MAVTESDSIKQADLGVKHVTPLSALKALKPNLDFGGGRGRGGSPAS